jgi:hypothetical protein
VAIAGGRLEMRGRGGVEALAEVPGKQRIEGGAQFVGRDVGEPRRADDEGREPCGGRRGECSIREVGPDVDAGAPRDASHEGDAVAKLALGATPGQPVDAEAGDAFGESDGGRLVGRDGARLAREDDGVEAAFGAGAERGGRRIEDDLGAARDASGGDGLEFVFVEARRERAAAATPVMSATTTNGAPERETAGSIWPARPLAKR